MRIPDPPLPPERMEEFRSKVIGRIRRPSIISNAGPSEQPDKTALIDHRVRLTFGEYFRRAKRLAAYFVQLGLDVGRRHRDPASELVGIRRRGERRDARGHPFLSIPFRFPQQGGRFHTGIHQGLDDRCSEYLQDFDHVAMLESLRDNAPNLRQSWSWATISPPDYFDLRTFLDEDLPQLVRTRYCWSGDRRRPISCARHSPLARPAIRKPCSTFIAPTTFCRRWMPS